MELQFHKTALPSMQLVKREIRNLEETQELRISDGMPDIGRVLGAWGQVLLRGKEWRSGSAHVSGGVQVWVMYMPEDGSGAQMVETWIPFQVKWELPELDSDGTICASCLLRSADARSTSSRKMMVRVNVGVGGELWAPAETWLYSPEELPGDICLLKQTYSVRMPREAGEKAFVLEEELMLPGSAPKLEKLLRYSLQPELIEQKIMSDKVVFRGMALLHILYRGEDGELHTWDFELPFSQYGELGSEYEQGAAAQITPAVTSMEADMDVEGRLRLKAGMIGQFLICEQSNVEVVEDVYSPQRQVTPRMETMQLFTVLDTLQQTVPAEQAVQAEGTMIDTTFCPDHPRQQQAGDSMTMLLPGQFQLLYSDNSGQLQSTVARWEGDWSMPVDNDALVMANVRPSGRPQTANDGAGILLRADMLMDAMTAAQQAISVVAGLEAGELAEPDPGRPSVILRRAGDNSLWEIAKRAGSTVEAIMDANQLETQPTPERILLIPIL